MTHTYTQFEQRKQDHIKLALMPENQTVECNPFDRICLMHEAIPDFDFEQVDILGQRLNKKRVKPFLVSSMTAGHDAANAINHNLVAACAQMGWAMGVGSQRRELTDEHAARPWLSIRKAYPKVSLYSNLGISQLAATSLAQVERLIDALEAEALIVHCNPLQECIQPEGTLTFKGCWDALAGLVLKLPIPVIVKETGCGFAASTMKRLDDIGVAAIDVSGLGGTHWGRIEGHRATNHQQKAADTFRNWGIDTVTSVLNGTTQNLQCEIWGSGGVRNGLDAAKLFALGASTVGYAKPMLEPALLSSEAVCERMTEIEYELKVAMFCTGSRQLSELKEKLCR